MKRTILILSFAILGLSTNAQIEFQKTYGGASYDYGFCAQQTTDGGYIVAGSTNSYGAGGYDIYLIKTNAAGDTLWTKTYGGAATDWVNSVKQTADGGYIITGYVHSFGAGGADVYLIKTNAAGDTLWSKTFGGVMDDYGYVALQTFDGGYIVSARAKSFGAGNTDVYLIKTNPNGDTTWTKTYGGGGADAGYAIQQTLDSGYIIAGTTASFGAGGNDIYLIKTNSSGDTLWSRTYGGTGDDQGFGVQQTTDGGYIVAGMTTSYGTGSYDVVLIKTNSMGDTLWSKTYGGGGDDEGWGVQQTTDGGYIVTGYTSSFGAGGYDVYLIKTNSSGTAIWSKAYGGTGNDYGNSVQQTTDRGYIITGQTNSFGAGGGDVYLIKTDSLGASGCNQNNAATVTSSCPFTVTHPNTQIHYGGIVTSPPTQIGFGGIVSTPCTTVGIEEMANGVSVSIYPNPFSSSATLLINGETKDNLYLYIYDLLGQEVKSMFIGNQKEVTIDRDNLVGGMYFYRIMGRNNEVVGMGKVIVE